jgi:ribonuclease D
VSELKYDHILRADALAGFCDDISTAPTIAFDTEFVSEDSYRPELCLIQVAAGGRLAVIDPLAIGNVDCFWELVAHPGHRTVVHAGREEFRFCRHAIQRRPAGWFDTQLAAAFVGMEFPAAYNTLVARLANETLPKGETRSDWRRRPLSTRQIEYALQDVIYLEEMADLLADRVGERGRQQWLEEDVENWQGLLEDYDQQERWDRVSGISGLSRRSLAIVRELWRWRDSEAQRRNRPPKHLLRDDLIVELAKRKTADSNRIKAVRGLDRGNFKRHLPDITAAVERGLAIADSECPRLPGRPRANTPQFVLLGQFMNAVLGCICRSVELAPTLVGTVQDVRDLVAHQLDPQFLVGGKLPALARGWRSEVVGRVLADVLAGRMALRVSEPLADQPLEIVDLPGPDRS